MVLDWMLTMPHPIRHMLSVSGIPAQMHFLAETTPISVSEPFWGPIFFVAVATLVYLLVDVYLSTQTFLTALKTVPFLLLLIIFVLFGIVSYFAMHVALWNRALAYVGEP